MRDQGIGFKNPNLIGKMFTQLDVVNNVNQNGIGFGLTISRMIVEKLGGHMRFRNHTNFEMDDLKPPPVRRRSCQSSIYTLKHKNDSILFKQEIVEQQRKIVGSKHNSNSRLCLGEDLSKVKSSRSQGSRTDSWDRLNMKPDEEPEIGSAADTES